MFKWFIFLKQATPLSTNYHARPRNNFKNPIMKYCPILLWYFISTAIPSWMFTFSKNTSTKPPTSSGSFNFTSSTQPTSPGSKMLQYFYRATNLPRIFQHISTKPLTNPRSLIHLPRHQPPQIQDPSILLPLAPTTSPRFSLQDPSIDLALHQPPDQCRSTTRWANTYWLFCNI